MGKISAVRALNPDGSVSIGYMTDETPCLHVVLQGPKAESAAKYQYVYKELEFCEAAINLFLNRFPRRDGSLLQSDLENNDDLTLRALYIASVITYAKCFTEAGKGRTRLDRHKVFKNKASGYLEFHEWIMEHHRHGYLAHSKENAFEEAYTLLLLLPPGMSPDWNHVSTHAQFTAAPNPKQMRDFLCIVKHTKRYTKVRVQDYTRSIKIDAAALDMHRKTAIYARLINLPQAPPEIFPHLAEDQELD